MTLHVGRPNLPNKTQFLSYLTGIWERNWLTNDGPLVQEFEQKISKLLGVEHCIAVANATIGLQLVAKALGLTGEVIVPSFTFIATAHALSWIGLTPVFCDIDRHTWCINPERVERLITEKASAILGVHLFGRPCDHARLSKIARAHELQLFYDAAHAFGCGGIGGLGEAEVFSFHATKCINSFEGGMITTNHQVLAERLRLMRNFGFEDEDLVVSLGINGKMSEVHAAMGLASLAQFQDVVLVNRQNFGVYRTCLTDVLDVTLHYPGDNYQYIVLEVYGDRDGLYEALRSEGVLARRYFNPGCHKSFPYAFAWSGRQMTVTDYLSAHVLCLPTGMSVTYEDIERICGIIRNWRDGDGSIRNSS